MPLKLEEFRRFFLGGSFVFCLIGTVGIILSPTAPLYLIAVAWGIFWLQYHLIMSDENMKKIARLDPETYELWFGEDQSD